MGKTRLKYAAASLIAVVLLSAGPVVIRAEAAPGASIGNHDTTVPSQEGMSPAATKVLHHIVEARAAIHSGEPTRAEREWRQGLALINRIKGLRPSTRIADHVWVAETHLDYQEPHEVALEITTYP